MPGRLRITVLACAIAATIAGCGAGDDGTIPSDEANALLTQLDAIENDIEVGNCDLAQEHAADFAARVSQLPEDVDPKVRQGLAEASTQVVDLANEPSECEEITGATGETGVEPTTIEEEPTTTEEDSTTTEEDSTTKPDEETETEPEEEQPPEEPAPEEDEGNDEPLEVPGEGEGSGGRNGSGSGGVEPDKGGGAKQSRPAPLLRRLVGGRS